MTNSTRRGYLYFATRSVAKVVAVDLVGVEGGHRRAHHHIEGTTRDETRDRLADEIDDDSFELALTSFLAGLTATYATVVTAD
ncbi:hypothetical protein ACTWPB_23505 [Nocardia sp. IBHARD005]|uniref:hypothetical protein n=1 Tax=Nocardia sp. IBHARD005 TaxID=3457765 RepID=UPI0040581D9C